jgi:hypothetical protein
LALSACGTGGDSAEGAQGVCKQLEDAGIAANCRGVESTGLGAASAETYKFDLPSVPGEGGQVMRFDNVEQYNATVASYAEMEALAGPHRYGNPEALIFVQINEGLSEADGETVKSIVDEL